MKQSRVHDTDNLEVTAILAALLNEFSAITDYRTLRDTLPQRLASLLHCRYILLYQRIGETLQFTSGSVSDNPGWSATLLSVTHLNPIELQSELPEAQAWRARRAIMAEQHGAEQALVCTPLIYRQRAIGVLTALRGWPEAQPMSEMANGASIHEISWTREETPVVEVVANVVAMLLENTRLLERDRERIHELSLLNGIISQMNSSLRERARVQRIVLQRAKEISTADLCEVLLPETPPDKVAWLPPALHTMLLQRWQSDLQSAPLVLERTSETQSDDYLSFLSPHLKTFFALPLLGNRTRVDGGSLAWHALRRGDEQSNHIFGVIVGAYEKPWKLRREDVVLLQILANQASAVLENIALVEDVIEARNEARRLLHQVLDDQRIKELILESIPSGLITIDMRGLITTFNRAAEAVLGYHPVEVIGQPARKILAVRSLEHVLQTGQSQHETLLTNGRQGQEVALDVTLAPLRDDRGRQIGVLATFADVTSMHHLEEETRRLDRLASLGKMSASVAHEVRNPLASIKTSMQMLRDDVESNAVLQKNEDIREAISVVLKEVERLDGIVHDLLLFARPRHLHLIECDLLELSEHILHFLQPQCAEHSVRVHLVRQEIPLVSVDTAQIEQVLMNVFLNALQAMPDGGILSVSCQVVQAPALTNEVTPHLERRSPVTPLLEAALLAMAETEPRTIDIQNEAPCNPQEPQSWLEMSVSDTGTGITQDDLAHIFQPFYTTKAHGIGLGLSITRRFIEDHHGSILIESQLGYGTTVSVRLPLNKA